jgi:hypothetical protein
MDLLPTALAPKVRTPWRSPFSLERARHITPAAPYQPTLTMLIDIPLGAVAMNGGP